VRERFSVLVTARQARAAVAAVHLADITDPAQAHAPSEDAVRRFGRLGALVNNDSVGRQTTFAGMTPEGNGAISSAPP